MSKTWLNICSVLQIVFITNNWCGNIFKFLRLLIVSTYNIVSIRYRNSCFLQINCWRILNCNSHCIISFRYLRNRAIKISSIWFKTLLPFRLWLESRLRKNLIINYVWIIIWIKFHRLIKNKCIIISHMLIACSCDCIMVLINT